MACSALHELVDDLHSATTEEHQEETLHTLLRNRATPAEGVMLELRGATGAAPMYQTPAEIVDAGVLATLVELVCSDVSPRVFNLGINVLASLIDAPKLRAPAVDAGALRALVCALSADAAASHDACKVCAARALERIAHDKQLRERVIEADALLPLLKLLETGASGACKASAARAIAAMCGCPTCVCPTSSSICTRVVEAGALPLLLKLLASEVADERASATCALAALVADETPRAQVVAAGALPALASALCEQLRASEASADKIPFALALADLSRAEPALCEQIVSAGALPSLVARLAAHSDSPADGVRAARSLANLSVEEPLRTPIAAEEGALATLISLLHVRTEDGDMETYAALCIANLAASPSLRARLTDALPPLASLLLLGTEATKIHAILAVESLSLDAALRVPIVESGVLPGLLAMLSPQRGAHEPAGRGKGPTRATRALAQLACEPTLRERLVYEGALRPLVTLLASQSDDIKANATFALANIAHEERLRMAIVKAEAVPPLLALLEEANGSVDKSGKCALRAAASAVKQLALDPAAHSHLLAAGAAGVLATLATAASGLSGSSEDSSGQGRQAPSTIAASALKLLCPDDEAIGRALRAVHQRACAAERRSAQLTARLEALADLVRAPNSALKHDVIFRCANGVEIGGSRLLLAHASAFFASLFDASSRATVSEAPETEARSRASHQHGWGFQLTPAPTPLEARERRDVDERERYDFTAAFTCSAHSALLRQLHAQGEAALPADHAVTLELLVLAAKVRAPDGDDVVARVVARCEAAVRSSLDASNCIEVLLALAPDGGVGDFRALCEAAQTEAFAHLAGVLQQPAWLTFAADCPDRAVAVLQSIALSAAAVGQTMRGPFGFGASHASATINTHISRLSAETSHDAS